MPRLELAEIESHLRTKIIGKAAWPNELWDEIESTNLRAVKLAAEGGPEGIMVLARRQLKGRGRLGRVWHSPFDAGIYISFLLRPNQPGLTRLTAVTLAAGVAAAQAIEDATGIKVGLKWVNDLIFDTRKVGGILAECSSGPSATSLVIGIGVNACLKEEEIPDELKDKIEWLERLTSAPVDLNILASELAYQLERVYTRLLSGESSGIIDEWRSRSVTLGHAVIASSGNEQIEGLAADVTESGALIVRQPDGQLTEIHAGEVSVRTADGRYC